MRRPILHALLALTLLVLLADLAGAPLGPVRGVGAATLGPIERLVAPGPDETARLEKENLRLTERVRRLEDRAAEAGAIQALPTGEWATTTGRVVALDRAGASGPRRVTLDVGRRDGIRVDSAVIAPGGLLGRVVGVADWTCDVEVLGSPGAAVGVRTGAQGVIGTVAGSDPTTAHDVGDLVITQLTRARTKVGDEVVTLGSPGQRPYPPGISVGSVTKVERGRGRLTDTAVIAPSVDLATIDVVAVLTRTASERGGASQDSAP